MKFQEMLEYIHTERSKLDNVVNAILQKCGGKTMRADTPAVDPERLKKEGCLFRKEKN